MLELQARLAMFGYAVLVVMYAGQTLPTTSLALSTPFQNVPKGGKRLVPKCHLLFPLPTHHLMVILIIDYFSHYVYLGVGQRMGAELRSPGLVASAFIH